MGRRAFRRNDVIDQQSRSQTEPIPAATRNVHLDNATSVKAALPESAAFNWQDSNHLCLVQLKIATDTPRLLGLAIWLWTIPAQVVQIDIAISATEPSGCVERRQARPRVHGVPSLELGSGAVEGGARPARRRRRSSGVFGDAVLALGALVWRTSTVQSALARESNQAAAERRRRWPHSTGLR